MDKMTPMDPEYQETPPEWQPGTPGYYGTGRLPKPPRSHTGLIVVLLCVMIVANVITVLMLLTLRMRAVQKNTTVGAETETDVTPTLTAPSGHSVEPTEPRTNGTGTLQISAEDTQTRSAGEIYTALRPSLALVYADGNGGTAIVMTADGYLITNAHTVSGAESITVQLSDGTEYAAALSGMDESSDLAVLKIEPETALQPAEFGDSAGAAAGDTVYVFSHPFGAAFDNATMTDGSIAAVQSGVRHGQALEQCDVANISLEVSPNFMVQRLREKGLDGAQFGPSFAVSMRLRRFLRLFQEEFHGQRDEADLRCLAALVISELIECGCRPQPRPAQAEEQSADTLGAMEEFIYLHYTQPLTIDGLSAQCGMQRNHFITAFKRRFGETPYARIVRLRLAKAKVLLRGTDDTVRHIYALCGFPSSTAFANAFRKDTGRTPGEFRDMQPYERL